MKKIASIITLLIAYAVAAQVPETMHFQGFLSDPGSGDAVADGNYSITFNIFDASTAGASLWTETHAAVSVADGYFSVILGTAGTPLTISFDIPYYLEVEVGGETLSPRYTLSTSAYAFTAKGVEGLTLSNGRLGLGTVSPTAELDIVGTDVGGGIQGRSQNLDATGWSSYTLRNDLGNAYSISIGGSAASVAPGKFYIFNGYTSSSSMVVAENGYIGIGTDNPQQLLNLSADGKATIKVDSYSDTQSSGISFLRSRGSLGNESSVQIADILGRIEFRGFENTLDDFITSAKIQARAAETWGSSSYGSELVFSTVENGTNVMEERMIIDHNGNVGIGTENPDQLLNLQADGGAVIKLDSYSDSQSSGLNFLKARGTFGSESSVLTDDILGSIAFRGFETTLDGFFTATTIQSRAAQDWSLNSYGSDIIFSTIENGTSTRMDRMIIDHNGNVGIGTEDPGKTLEVKANQSSNTFVQFGNESTSSDADILTLSFGNISSAGSGNYFISFRDTDGVVGSVSGNGSTAINYNNTSDRRLKQNIKSLNNSLGIIDKIQPRTYEYRRAPDINQIGFIAQELEEVYPQAVSGDPNGDVNTDPMMVDYSKLTPLLTGGIKELLERVEALEKENTSLKASNSHLKSELGALKSSLDRIEKALSIVDEKEVETIDSED